jgi:hypothetical protein
MSNKWKARLMVLTLGVIAGMGCNPILMTAYLFNNDDPKMPADFALKPQPKHEKEDVKIVVLTSCAPGITPEMIGVDRLLAAEFIPLLEARCRENKEKVTVLKSAPIDEYKKNEPEWRNQHPTEIAKHFKADYVIDIEVLDIEMFEPGTRREQMKGRAKVAVAAYDLSKKLKEPAYNPPEFNFEYPKTHMVSRFDEPPSTFRQKFIKRIAADLVLPFTQHKANQAVMVD